ncbi:hypothetical protein L207DRAFT_617081 [Hyaloscypha variabilis F]|uniref:Uncharacterized protein n=1 Tax=Hyaloscypha variabilis (strain UAMH 11265 / GT02V1 / F) TaxID=1149755 RepID=A0A2J6S3W2_HYAVF|nr:hypothetical protein L207DRAFT_617081 [Hyaloscypha variabilis F]
MASTHDPDTNQTSLGDLTVRKLWDLQRELKKAESMTSDLASCLKHAAENLRGPVHGILKDLKGAVSVTSELMYLTDGRISDIVEVLCHHCNNEDRIQVVQYPSGVRTDLALSPSANEPSLKMLFSDPETPKSEGHFECHDPIFFLSPLMAKEVDFFIEGTTVEERSIIQTLAISHQMFEKLDKTLLTRFTALKAVIVVAEIPTDNNPKRSQQVVLQLIPPTTSRNNVPSDAEAFRIKAENQLDQIRVENDAWPAGRVGLAVAWVERDGKLMATEFPFDTYTYLKKKKTEEEDQQDIFNSVEDDLEPDFDDNESAADEAEEEDSEQTPGGDGNSREANGPDQISDRFGTLDIGRSLEELHVPAGAKVDEETMRKIVEADRKFDERNKKAEIKEAKAKRAKVADEEGW